MQNNSQCELRPITADDNQVIATIIKQCLIEYGANKEGFAWADPELDRLSTVYTGGREQYWLLIEDDKVVGGAGFSQLQGASESESELQKMYLLPEARGKGYASKLMQKLIELAKEQGYHSMYLETLDSMHEANRLYQKFGFKILNAPRGDTGHGGCDTWYLLEF